MNAKIPAHQPIEPTPVSLLERLAQREDAQAWGRFVELYTPLLVYWVRRLGVPEASRADVLQDIFTVLLQKLPEFHYDPSQRFRGYLFTVTRSKAMDRHRRDQRDKADALPEDLPEDSRQLQTLFENDYRDFLVARIIELTRPQVDEKTWQAFWKTVCEGRRPADVAAELGLSPESVYQARTRMIRRIRSEMDGLID